MAFNMRMDALFIALFHAIASCLNLCSLDCAHLLGLLLDGLWAACGRVAIYTTNEISVPTVTAAAAQRPAVK